MKLSTLKLVAGWIFIGGHFSNFIMLFLWGLFWSEKGFAGISDLLTLLLPISGVASLAAVKAFWSINPSARKRVSINIAILTILLPSVLTVLIWCLLIAYVMQLAAGPDTVKLGVGLCEMAFGGSIAFIVEKLFSLEMRAQGEKPKCENEVR